MSAHRRWAGLRRCDCTDRGATRRHPQGERTLSGVVVATSRPIDRDVGPASYVCHRNAPKAGGVDLVFGHQVEHDIESDLALNSCESGTEAAVDAVPEVDVVPGGNPVDVEPIGVGECAFVAGR